ncbi:MAG: isoprenylcysteine carboxylmethyltransferase family protein [Proteobacteria bacterium]|nr:isoprenylcysteine carboxylmethyltransferase family protein [Pseudomonadota bacterium]
MDRSLAVLYGVAVYLLFLATFGYTIGFVEGIPGLKTLDSGAPGDVVVAVVVDAALLLLFALQHTIMARRGFKRWWTRFVPAAVERSTFVLAASLAVALLIWQWRPLAGVVWSVTDPGGRLLLFALSALGWSVLLVSTFLINHFELFGLHQVYEFWRRRPFVPPAFKTPVFYRYVRHPIYLGFVLAFWATPQMSAGHLLFAIATTGYILVGILFEERDLIAHFGEEYRRYRERVPMLVPFLGRRASPAGQREPGVPLK